MIGDANNRGAAGRLVRDRRIGLLLCLWCATTIARAGISGYLPLNLEPRIEHDVERLMVLADEPVIRRPITLAAIERAMPAACAADEPLCMQVQREIAPWMGRAALGMASFEAAVASAAQVTQPNERGAPMDAKWQVAAQGYVRVGEHAAVNVGGVAYRGRVNPSGSFVSLGFARAQLDLGFRDHWWSPMRDSSMLISSEAPTLPSVTVSNSVPLTRVRLHYEAFVARLSQSDAISYQGALVSGYPRLAGAHVSIEPVKGLSFAASRLLQFGGGGRPESLRDLLHAFFQPYAYDNQNPGQATGIDAEFGNQQVSLSSQLTIGGPKPISVYAEFAGEDTFHGQNFRFGNNALSFGVFLPKFRPDAQLRYEFSNWEDVWYVHHLYGDGLSNYGRVLGNWGADWRSSGDSVGGQSHMLQLDWQRRDGSSYAARYRTAQNAGYNSLRQRGNYRRAHLLSLTASAPWRSFELAAGLDLGRDMYGKAFGRLSLTLYAAGDSRNSTLAFTASDARVPASPVVERFVEVGFLAGRMRYEEDAYVLPARTTNERAMHYGVGVRRSVSRRSDFGARFEVDNLHGHNMYSIRALDYRLRAGKHFAYTGFLGFSRYELRTPAHGYYAGAGVQLRDVRPGWDLNLEGRYFDRIVRKKLAPDERVIIWPNEFYTMPGIGLSLSRRF